MGLQTNQSRNKRKHITNERKIEANLQAIYVQHLFVFFESFHVFFLLIVVIRITNMISHCMRLNKKDYHDYYLSA